MPSTTGTFNYLGPMEGVPLFCGDQPAKNRINLVPHEMPVLDMRETDPSLDKEGFILADLPLGTSETDDVEAIARTWRPLLEDYLRDLTGAPPTTPITGSSHGCR